MKVLCVTSSLVACVVLSASLRAEGFLYRLPDDGTWAKFDMVGNAVDPDGTQTTLSGTMTISSVGTTDMDEQKCRWIEISFDGKRNDQSFATVEKLLIPEKYLAKGEDPLAHVLKAWTKHSNVSGGEAHQIEDVGNAESRGGKYLRGSHLRPFLHGPYQNPQKLDKTVVESKLGKLECEGISAQEHTDGSISSDSKFIIRLHKDAPFGVVTWEAEAKLEQDGKPLGTMTTKATLSDFGQNAKSGIPEAK